MAKERWRISVDTNMKNDYINFESWYLKQFKKLPTKVDFIKTSLELFNDVRPHIKRKKRSKKIECLLK